MPKRVASETLSERMKLELIESFGVLAVRMVLRVGSAVRECVVLVRFLGVSIRADLKWCEE
jgi:hypothetical protein